MTRSDLFALLGLCLFALFPALAWAGGVLWAVDLASRMLIYGLAALALNLVLGYGGLVSFGHAAFVGAGAYVVAILSFHSMMGGSILGYAGTESGFVAFPLAILVSGLLALAIGAMSLKTSGLYFIMITLAFAQMIYYLFVSLPDYGGEDGLSLWARSDFGPLDIGDDVPFFYLCLGLVAAFALLKRRLVASRFGWTLMGLRDNERRMRAMGTTSFRYKLVAFGLSGAVAGLAGALLANQTEFVSPSFLSWHLSGELLVIVILGGMGTLYGPLAGAVAFLLLEFALKEVTEHWQLVLGPILILVVLYARRGLWGLVEGKRDG
jgi:branched-chain amino acid transport system permease protein